MGGASGDDGATVSTTRVRATDRPPPAPAAVAETILSARRNQEDEDQRSALRRLLLIALIAYPSFALADVLGAYNLHALGSLPFVLGVRALGTCILVAVFLVVRRRGVSRRVLAACDYFIFACGGLFLSLQAIVMGGLQSRFILGVMTVAFARATLIPSRFWRALGVGMLAALTFPLVMAAAAPFDAAVRAQWASPAAVGGFLYDFIVLAGAVVLGSVGSHLGWKARRQVMEARKLGSYRLKARIGSGGNGDVWLARQDPLGREVALKVLKERGMTDEESIVRFQREARAASLLKHPNTIRIYEFGASDDGVLFIAMELLDGRDLEDVVAMAGALPARRALHFARQACASLAEAHDAGIVHRDIKPANLFVTHAGDDFDFLKLLDFGVARVVEGGTKGSSLSETGLLFGTPAYMSPEVCGGERADPRSDIYSLGAVLYFMLTATPLFPGKPFAETVMAHVSKMPETPSERLGRALPGDLDALVMRCLAKGPGERFQTARALDEDLARCEQALGAWTPQESRDLWAPHLKNRKPAA
jgi:serine/threonine-protein kinase